LARPPGGNRPPGAPVSAPTVNRRYSAGRKVHCAAPIPSNSIGCCRSTGAQLTSIGGCRMFRIIVFVFLVALYQPISGWAEELPAPPPHADQNETLKDAAIVALIIAASVAAYKSMGRPCACPSDVMRNGRPCGGRSAWSKAGGARPLCLPSDVTAGMISAYRASKAIPSLF